MFRAYVSVYVSSFELPNFSFSCVFRFFHRPSCMCACVRVCAPRFRVCRAFYYSPAIQQDGLDFGLSRIFSFSFVDFSAFFVSMCHHCALLCHIWENYATADFVIISKVSSWSCDHVIYPRYDQYKIINLIYWIWNMCYTNFQTIAISSLPISFIFIESRWKGILFHDELFEEDDS